jgi:methyltransferase-like protein/2-polyprenyl-3-methyl-5-hydroxy-6-metoxy-1,4-benzoquinol methylase
MSISILPPNADNAYDEIPYESYPYKQSHPDNLATIAELFGMKSPEPAGARILELGCASGGNIIPLAIKYPKAKIVGIDLSKIQINLATKQANDLKLNNIKFHQISITDIDESYGKFDYIIAHGVISWVPGPVRQKIFDICGQLLSDNGVAYISYNALPGWNMIKSIREMMLFHGNNFTNTDDKLTQAKLFLQFVKEVIEKNDTPYAKVIQQEVELLASQHDSYIMHDHMEEENHPYYLYKFIEEADKRGLQYLGDTNLASMYLGNMPDEVSRQLGQIKDIVRVEQYMDFINNRRFRSSLLCRKSASLNRSLKANDIEKFYLAINVTADVPYSASLKLDNKEQSLKFYLNNKKDQGISTISSVMKAILYTFAENPLTSLSIDQVVKAASSKLPNFKDTDIRQELVDNAMNLVFSGYMQISNEAHNYVTKIDNKPIIYKLARYQAEHINTTWVTNAQSQMINITILEKYSFKYMDGKHTKEEIIDLVLDNHIAKGQITVNKDGVKLEEHDAIKVELAKALDQILQRALKVSLLVNESDSPAPSKLK